jgi:hypothetical protein
MTTIIFCDECIKNNPIPKHEKEVKQTIYCFHKYVEYLNNKKKSQLQSINGRK